MDRCYKLKVLIIVLTCVLIPTSLIYSNELDTNSNIKASPIQAKTVKQQKREVINITNEELLLLSKLVTGEARGESYEGQVAVAAVVKQGKRSKVSKYYKGCYISEKCIFCS